MASLKCGGRHTPCERNQKNSLRWPYHLVGDMQSDCCTVTYPVYNTNKILEALPLLVKSVASFVVKRNFYTDVHLESHIVTRLWSM